MTQNQKDTYRAALKEARGSFDKAKKRREEITRELGYLTDEIGRLRKTITALAAMCSESPGFDALGITDACMEVMESYPVSLSTGDVVSSLEDMGFDIRTQKNPNASVHAVLSRLAKSGKIAKIEADEGDKVVWRGPNYDAQIDSSEDIPF